MEELTILDSHHPIQPALKDSGWSVASYDGLEIRGLIVQHPELAKGTGPLLLTTEALSASMSPDKIAASFLDSDLRIVLLLDGSIRGLIQDVYTPIGGLLITQSDQTPFHGTTTKWAHDLNQLLSSPLDEASVAAQTKQSADPASIPDSINREDPPVAQRDGAPATTDLGDTTAKAPDTTASSAEKDALSVASWVLSDKPIQDFRDDQFGFRAYAEALAGVINDDRTDTPLVIAINAPWGAGKSSLGKMIQKLLKERPAAGGSAPHVTIWFNAWLHDDAESLDSALIAAIGRETDGFRDRWRDILWRSPRIWGMALGFGLILVASIAAQQIGFDPGGEDDAEYLQLIAALGSAIGGAGGLGGIGWLIYLFVRFYSSWGADLLRLITDRKAAAASVSMSECRDKLQKMISRATPQGSRFVIFIDDIERCRPPKSIDLLEAINQLLNFEQVVVVLMGDMPTVAKHVDIKYRDLVGENSTFPARLRITGELQTPPQEASTQLFEGSVAVQGESSSVHSQLLDFSDFGRRYLQKIIQLQFDMPVPGEQQIRKLLENLSNQSPDPEVSSLQEGDEPPTGDDTNSADETNADKSKTDQPEIITPVPPWLERAVNRSRKATGWLSAALVLGFAGTAILNGAEVQIPEYLQGVFGYLMFGIFIGLMIAVLVQGFLKQRYNSALKRYEEEIENARQNLKKDIAAMEDTAPENLYRFEETAATTGSDQNLENVLRQEQKRQFITSDSTLVNKALETIFEHMPMHPRNAKRILNKLRLIILVTYYRRVLTSESTLGAQHIGKWVVLNERWPELAIALRDQPGRLDDLENSATNTTQRTVSPRFRDTVGEFMPRLREDADLERFLSVEPLLAPVANELILYSAKTN